MAETANIAAAFVIIAAKLGVSVTYSGNTYTGAKSVLDSKVTYQSEGMAAQYAMTIRILKSALDANSDDPQADEKVTIGGVTYRIMAVRPDPFGVIVRLDLGAEY